MNATRRLDMLALIGGVVAVAMLIAAIWSCSKLGRMASDIISSDTSASLTGSLPDSDTRADLKAISQAQPYHPHDDAVRTLTAAIRRYPESARLYFRLGVLAKDPQSTAALRKVADLDPGNALPLYLLASKASESGQWDRAMHLTAEGNRRRYADAYMPRTRVTDENSMREMQMLTCYADTQDHVYKNLRDLCRSIADHSARLHRSGRTQMAVEELQQIRQMGWKVAASHDAVLLDALVGASLVRTYQKSARMVYSDTGDRTALSSLDDEAGRLTYVRAGSRMYADGLLDHTAGGFTRFMLMSLPIMVLLFGHAMMVIFGIIFMIAYARKSAGQQPSALLVSAIDTSYPGVYLLSLYGSVLLVLWICSSGISRCAGDEAVGPMLVLYLSILVLTPIISSIVADSRHLKAYRQAAEKAGGTVPKKWQHAPVADKLQAARASAGVHGGMMITIFIWAVLVSLYMRSAMGTYPWHPERAFPSVYQTEHAFVHDLVAGKVNVPAKYIKAEQKRQLDALRKTRSGERDK